MSPHDFVYNHVYRGALKEGVSERVAQSCAVQALDEYKKNKIKQKASGLILSWIKEAKKQDKRS